LFARSFAWDIAANGRYIAHKRVRAREGTQRVAEGIRAEGGSDTRRRQGGYGGEEEPDIGEGRQKEAEIERGKGRERERERRGGSGLYFAERGINRRSLAPTDTIGTF